MSALWHYSQNQESVFWHLLNYEDSQTQDLTIKISTYLVVISDFPALAAVCEQAGYFSSILRQVVLFRDTQRFGHDIALRRKELRKTRLVLLRELSVVEREFASHRPLTLQASHQDDEDGESMH